MVDVLIIGAGISGINAAYRLQTELPHLRFAILEARSSMGGTWDLFRYPGIRSDSDLYTFGFQWYPWNRANPIAEGGDILQYLDDAATTHHIKEHIRFNHRVISADWKHNQWTIHVARAEEDDETSLTARFIIFATGYYDYHQPLQAAIPGLDHFTGQVIHPQFWPSDFDPANKKIVVIGSGATAVTLVPSLAPDAESVTMLQRSPTYIAAVPNPHQSTSLWTHLLPKRTVYHFRRLFHLIVPHLFYRFCHAFPAAARSFLLRGVASRLPVGTSLAPHFTPSYNPWDQRLCACPDGDFFRALASTKARVHTDTISQVHPDHIQLTSGATLPADVIVTATGLKVQVLAGIPITVNGEPYRAAGKYAWNGLMLQDLPNATLVLGFTNASWTLGADIAMRLTCRLLKYMNNKNYGRVVPVVEGGVKEETAPLLDLKSTYIKRAAGEMPRASAKRPWVSRTSYFQDLYFAYWGDLREGLVFA